MREWKEHFQNQMEGIGEKEVEEMGKIVIKKKK